MSIKVRIDTVTFNKTTKKYDVYTTLYDDAGPVDIARKCFAYSTSISDDAVRNAVIEAYKYPANAYIRRGEVKSHLALAVSTLIVPTTFEPLAPSTVPFTP